MDIIRGARKRKPFEVVSIGQGEILSYFDHFAHLFKKVVKTKKRSLGIQKARILYSADHISEVWVKYTSDKGRVEQIHSVEVSC